MRNHAKTTAVLALILPLLLCTTSLAQDIKITKRVMTEEEFNHFKNAAGIQEHGRNYNIKIRGHGTGLRPPTEQQWQEIRNVPIVADKMEFTTTEPPVAVDNSATEWFPPIGNQGAEGSCTCWATTYYTKTFQEAHEHGWALTPDTIFSPDFVYHLINGGKDGGSWYWDAIDLMANIGAASWTNMPYRAYDSTTWPSESAWREAPLYRNEYYFFIDVTTDQGIGDLKNFIGSPNLAVIGVNANKYELLSGEDLWTSDTYTTTSINHSNTIVGYDDNFGPYIEDGVTKYGAFKVANSWGISTSWENVPDGFYWISYACLKKYIERAHCYENIVDYHPEMIAVFEVSHDLRGECNTTVGIGSASLPVAEKAFDTYIDGGKVPFPPNKIVMDVTEVSPDLLPGWNEVFLSVYDGGTRVTGTVNYFAVEIYDDYFSAVPTGIFESYDVPLDTLKRKTVYAGSEVFLE